MFNNRIFISLVSLVLILRFKSIKAAVAPILDIENESVGYLGTIGERNVLVDLKPHLQIKNIDAINGICSYHVFKPNTEEFPFTIDIKDKVTGEAVIEVIKKDSDTTSSKSSDLLAGIAGGNRPSKSIVLDCNKRKEFNFFIQAHDCSSPSIPSAKIPVKIEVIDHDDYVPKFDETFFKKTIVESNEIYENFMEVKARDNDCTNDGYACVYKLFTTNDMEIVDKLFAIKVDNAGLLSTTRPVKQGETFEFKLRAYDCLNKDSYAETQVRIEVIEPCVQQWSDYPNEIVSNVESINLFDNIKITSCDLKYQNVFQKQDSLCQIESAHAKVTLNLDDSIKNNCQMEKCDQIKSALDSITQASTVANRVVLFSAGNSKTDYEDDDNIEDDDDDLNKVIASNDIKPLDQSLDQSKDSLQPPLNFQSFSKVVENAQKIDFDGKFGDEFTLSAWIRRPPNADKTIKEQVLCGTDSLSMNRHHYGLYFYRGNLKFLLRRESDKKDDQKAKQLNTDDAESNEIFYPSLWEWSLYEPLISDNKWHYYEVRFSYPNASLYIDGVRFAENTTNSDIIDAYELSDISGINSITTYVGACYHARTKTLLDHFEGDIANLVLTKKSKPQQLSKKEQVICNRNCNEYIEANMVGNENYISSIKLSSQDEISVKTSNLNDLTQILRKVTYINKETYPQAGSRSILISSYIQCANNGKQIAMKDININLNVKRQKQEYNVQLEGAKQLTATKFDLENGIEPFKDITIVQAPINKIDDTPNSYDSSSDDDVSKENDSNASESSENNSNSDSKSVKLSKCIIKIVPERNLMAPTLNNEKVMFLQNLLDDFNFKFEETNDYVSISGIQSVENYETFIRHLTYVITNINDVEPANLALIKNKQFFLSCLRNEPNIETNTILIQINLTKSEQEKQESGDAKLSPGFIAHKQVQKYVVSDSDDDILQKKTDYSSFLNSSNDTTSPLVVALIVMCSCAIGFLLVFGAIKLHTSRVFRGKRKALPNEENPQMEWDDSGLNITENPLETLEMSKECGMVNAHNHQNLEYVTGQYSSSDEEDEDDEESNDDEQYSSEEEPEKIVDRELEWDDTSLEIKIKDKQLQLQQQLNQSLTSNKSANFIDPNKFV